jgi:DNA-binding transcriptional ArsR family regulator
VPVLDLTSADLASVRFAVSPMSQLVGALAVLGGRRLPPGASTWRDAAQDRFNDLCRGDPLVRDFVSLLRSTRYVPDCVSVPPTRVSTSFEAELAALRATPVERLRLDLRRSEAEAAGSLGYVPSAAWDAPDLSVRLADALQQAWDELIVRDWPALKAVLEQDITYRSSVLATRGLAYTLHALDGDTRWVPNGRLELRGRSGHSHRLAGAGLWLVPNAFGGGWLCLDVPRAYALNYPARGTGELWQGDARPGMALEQLIGRSRAAILAKLDRPATTTQLAAQLGLTIGAVGNHLAVLRRNRLVARTRNGRSVLYTRTPLAQMLVHEQELPTRTPS